MKKELSLERVFFELKRLVLSTHHAMMMDRLTQAEQQRLARRLCEEFEFQKRLNRG